MARVVKPEATLHAQTIMVGRPVAAFHIDNLVVLEVVGQLAADAAIGADRVDLFISRDTVPHAVFVNQGGGHQGPGGPDQ